MANQPSASEFQMAIAENNMTNGISTLAQTLNEAYPFSKPAIAATYPVNLNNDLHTQMYNESQRIYHGYGNYAELSGQAMLFAAAISGAVLFAIIGGLYVRQIIHILQNTPTKHLARTLILCGVYAIVGAAALTSLLAYRSAVFCDSVCHFAFVMCAYQYFGLCVEYGGGETNFIKRTGGSMAFNLQTPPLCCCLKFLEPSPMTKKKFSVLRIMVLQMPIIQGAILAASNVLNAVDQQLYESSLPFFVPFILTSILTGVWALQITARMIAPYLPEFKIMQKYFAIQLVLVVCKLQPAIIQAIFVAVNAWTDYQIKNKSLENGLIQLAILLETAMLSLFANHLYQIPSKGVAPY